MMEGACRILPGTQVSFISFSQLVLFLYVSFTLATVLHQKTTVYTIKTRTGRKKANKVYKETVGYVILPSFQECKAAGSVLIETIIGWN